MPVVDDARNESVRPKATPTSVCVAYDPAAATMARQASPMVAVRPSRRISQGRARLPTRPAPLTAK